MDFHSTSTSIIVINKTRLFDGIGGLKIRYLFFHNRTKICLYGLHNLAINPFVFNETGIIPFLTFICLLYVFVSILINMSYASLVFSLHWIGLKLMTLDENNTFQGS